jgi:phosphoribosylaminoimidazolecarboxamide formyltransferase/IMP cyclohydrolase
MMDGRVKTLHPKVHGGILARRDHPGDLDAATAHGIGLIDLVVVNLYPFAETAKKHDIAFDDLLEQIDIGGPSMVRAAAKNFRDVLVVVAPADYRRLLDALDKGPTLAFRFELMRKAFAHTAEYDTTIAIAMGSVQLNHDAFRRQPPSALVTQAHCVGFEIAKIRDLRYGENPHQTAAWFGLSADDREGFGNAAVLQGRELSYTNLLDLDAAARIVLEFEEPAAVVIKHMNPCGAATGASAADAYIRAREADSRSAFGGIVALNRPLDAEVATALAATFIEAVLAPAVETAAKPILAKKVNMRVVEADFSRFRQGAPSLLDFRQVELRSILGAFLLQERDRVVEAAAAWSTASLPEGLRVVTKRRPTDSEWEALRFAWRVCAHVKSNTVIFTDANRTLAIGAGQMSRVDAVNVAVMKARAAERSLEGSVAASDAYFPFRDGLDAVAAAGAVAVVQPGGSVRDAEVIAAADEHGLAMVFTGRRHFRH